MIIIFEKYMFSIMLTLGHMCIEYKLMLTLVKFFVDLINNNFSTIVEKLIFTLFYYLNDNSSESIPYKPIDCPKTNSVNENRFVGVPISHAHVIVCCTLCYPSSLGLLIQIYMQLLIINLSLSM